MGAQRWPELVLTEEAVSDERRAGVPPERRELPRQILHLVTRDVSARGQEDEERLVVGARGRRDDVAVAQHDPPQRAARLERVTAARARRDPAREHLRGVLRTEQQDGRHVGRSPDELGLEGGDRLVDDDDRGPRARHRRRGQCRRDAQELGGHGVRRGRRQRTTGVRRRPGAASVRLVRRQLYARPRRLCEAVILVLLERLVQRGQERLGEDRFDLLLGRRRGELPRHLRTDALLRLGEERLELRAEGRLDADRRPDGASGEGRFADPAGARGGTARDGDDRQRAGGGDGRATLGRADRPWLCRGRRAVRPRGARRGRSAGGALRGAPRQRVDLAYERLRVDRSGEEPAGRAGGVERERLLLRPLDPEEQDVKPRTAHHAASACDGLGRSDRVGIDDDHARSLHGDAGGEQRQRHVNHAVAGPA